MGDDELKKRKEGSLCWYNVVGEENGTTTLSECVSESQRRRLHTTLEETYLETISCLIEQPLQR